MKTIDSNESAGVECAKSLVLALTKLALLKSRGLPQDHKAAAEIGSAMLRVMSDLERLLREAAAMFDNVPDNVVAFTPKNKTPPARNL